MPRPGGTSIQSAYFQIHWTDEIPSPAWRFCRRMRQGAAPVQGLLGLLMRLGVPEKRWHRGVG